MEPNKPISGLSPIQLPGEAIVLALMDLVKEVIKDQPPPVKAELWNRYLEATKPFHDWWVKIFSGK